MMGKLEVYLCGTLNRSKIGNSSLPLSNTDCDVEPFGQREIVALFVTHSISLAHGVGSRAKPHRTVRMPCVTPLAKMVSFRR